MRTNARGTLTALALIATAFGCERPNCGEDLDYDYAMDRCVCPAPRVWSGDFCIDAPDAGPDAASPDAAIDSNAPTAPVVVISPSVPSTLDDLSAEIVTESVDPRGGTVSYEHVWIRNDEVLVDVTGAVVAASLTARSERWTVEVRASSADGRTGPPGRATIVIANSAPRLSTVGLSSYRPIDGELTTARPGTTYDPDGDSVSVELSWYIDDVLVAVPDGASFDAAAAGATPESSIRVDATPFDGTTRGETRSASGSLVANVTRWRERSPRRTFRGVPVVAYDPVHRRILLHYSQRPDGMPGESSLWEASMEGSERKFVKLHPEGNGPATSGATTLFDNMRSQVLVYGGLERGPGVDRLDDRVWALDTTRRGAERWQVVETVGDVPSARMFAAITHDTNTNRLWMYGGYGAAGTLDDLWSLDLSSTPARWVRHLVPTPGVLFGASFTFDAVRDRLLMMGGVEGETITDRIHVLDLRSIESGFVSASSRLPVPVALALTAIDATRDRVVLAYGSDGAGTAQRDVLAVDLITLESSTLTTTGAAPDGGSFGWLAQSDDGSRLYAFTGAGGVDRESNRVEVYSLDARTLEWTAELPYGDAAPAVFQATAVRSGPGRMWITGGTNDLRHIEDATWEVNADLGTSALRVVAPDAITMRSPPFRTGVVAESRDYIHTPLPLLGGRLEGGAFADTVAWQLSVSDGAWTESTLAGGIAPPSREGGLVFWSCSGPAYFGGRAPDGSLLADSGELACDMGDPRRRCHWVARAGTRPEARVWAAAARLDADAPVIIGGMGISGAMMDVWRLQACSSPPAQWTRIVPTGAAPPPRFGHTATFVPIGGTSSGTVLVFGGTSDGPAELLRDVWRLIQLSPTAYEWDAVSPASGPRDEMPAPRQHHVAVYDASTSRLLVHGGISDGEVLGDVWELRIR